MGPRVYRLNHASFVGKEASKHVKVHCVEAKQSKAKGKAAAKKPGGTASHALGSRYVESLCLETFCDGAHPDANRALCATSVAYTHPW